MFLKAIIWGLLLLGIAILGTETRERFLIAKLDAAHFQDTPLGIHKSGTILKFTPGGEFEFPLQTAIASAYENGYSDSLVRYLTHHYQKVLPYWETPLELRFQLDRLTDRMLKERQFTVVHPITGQRHRSFQILPESDSYYFAYAYEDGITFYEEEKPSISIHHYCDLRDHQFRYAIHLEEVFIELAQTCLPYYQAPRAPILQVNLDNIRPDLSTEFLRILANPDPTVY